MIHKAPRDPPDTAADLHKKKLWRIEWEREIVQKTTTEMMNAVYAELETLRESEKIAWELQAIQKLEEEIEGVRQLYQTELDKAREEAQQAKVHAHSQAELGNQFWADLQAKKLQVDFLQACLDENTSSTKGLAQDYQNEAIALLNQRDIEIKRLEGELTKAVSEIEDSHKVRNGAVEEVANHAEEITNFEERLEVVRKVNRDLFSAGVEKDQKIYRLEKALEEARNPLETSEEMTKGTNQNHAEEIKNPDESLEVVMGVNRGLRSAGVEKDQKIHQLEKILEGVRNLPEANQEVTKGTNESDGGSQSLTPEPNLTNASNVDIHLLDALIAKSRHNERLVRELGRKLANQEKESDIKLRELKTKMTASLKEVLKEKKEAVRKLTIKQNQEELVQLKNEHRIFQQRNNDMARTTLENAAEVARLIAQVNFLQSIKQKLLQEIRRLELRGDTYKEKLAIESKILDNANSKIAKLTSAIHNRDNKLAKTIRIQDAKIKTLEKTLRQGERTILTLRQWDAESGVTERDQLIKERDQRIQQYKKDEKEFLEHIENLEQELLKHKNFQARKRWSCWKISAWVFGTPPV